MNRALILAGGDDRRLRPLTCSKPKAMLPVCGRPVIDYTLALLKRQNFDPLIAADSHSDVLAEHLDGYEFIISRPEEGDCKAVSKAAESDICDITVINGGLLFDTDLCAALAAHRNAAADITVVTAVTDCPAEHTLAKVTDGLVTEIISDPARESCVSDLAVTGIFIVSRAAAEKAKQYGDILTEFIPAVISRGGKVLSFTAQGTFIDISAPNDLFTASNAVLNGKLPQINKSRTERHELDIVPPVYISDTADIAPHAVIGKDTVIGDNVTVCRGAKLNGAIIMDGAFIGERVTVNGGIIGAGARLLADSSVFEGAVIGDGAVIDEQAEVKCGVRIWNGKHIRGCASEDVKYGFSAPLKIGEDGICGVTPEAALRTGSALASLGERIGVGYRDNPASEALACALASGAAAAGAEVWLFGAVTAPELEYCTALSGLAAGCLVDCGVTSRLRFCSGDGLPLLRREEKLIEEGINRGDYKRAAFKRYGKIRNTEAVTRLYKNMLDGIASRQFKGIRAVLNTSGRTVTEMCGGILEKLGGKDGIPIVFHIGSDGRGTSAYTEETGYVFEEKLILLCCKRRFEQGRDIALPEDFPTAADRLAEDFGRKVLRYSCCPSDENCRDIRRLAAETPFVRDGAALMLSVLEALSAWGKSLSKAVSELPDMALAARFVAVDKRPVQLLRQLCGQAAGDGIVIDDERGRVMIRPVKTEKGVLMKAESFSVEAASELCDFYQDRLRSLSRSL